MPKVAKKGQKKSAYLNLADIKLSDYANSSHVGCSLRKKALTSTKVQNLYELEKAWLNQESEEFQDDDGDCYNNQLSKRKSRSSEKSQDKSQTLGIVYPIDLWYILADYIEPEDVKVFASICKGSYHVSKTYSFWIKLYKRNYHEESQLPLRLQPHCIDKPYCLKACVIRALYHLYPKFICKSPTHSQSWEIHKLLKSPCVAMWHIKNNSEWMFYFKFQFKFSNLHSEAVILEKNPPSNWMELDQSSYENPDELMKEVNFNPEDGYKILQVKSPNFVATPIVLGGSLADIKMGLTRDLTKQKLQLIFCFSNYKQTFKLPSPLGSRNCGGNAEVVEFDPVGSVVVLDWWNPRYPSVNRF